MFQPKISRKVRIFSLGWKNNILIKQKSVCRLWLLPFEFPFAERVLVQNVSHENHENHLIFMWMTVQVTSYFHNNSFAQTRFATGAKVNLGLDYSSMSCSGSVWFSFVGDQMQTSFQLSSGLDFESHSLWCIFGKYCWNINTLKMLRILFSLWCVKYISFGFIEALDLKEY